MELHGWCCNDDTTSACCIVPCHTQIKWWSVRALLSPPHRCKRRALLNELTPPTKLCPKAKAQTNAAVTVHRCAADPGTAFAGVSTPVAALPQTSISNDGHDGGTCTREPQLCRLVPWLLGHVVIGKATNAAQVTRREKASLTPILNSSGINSGGAGGIRTRTVRIKSPLC
jgi:hypothetical protein